MLTPSSIRHPLGAAGFDLRPSLGVRAIERFDCMHAAEPAPIADSVADFRDLQCRSHHLLPFGYPRDTHGPR
jgi:hypothetical protein